MSVRPRYPVSLEGRAEVTLPQLATDVQQLKQLTMVLEFGCLVTAYVGTIDAAYTSGRPMVDLPVGTKIGPCPYLARYTPAAGDTVLLVPAGQTYIVVDRIV